MVKEHSTTTPDAGPDRRRVPWAILVGVALGQLALWVWRPTGPTLVWGVFVFGVAALATLLVSRARRR